MPNNKFNREAVATLLSHAKPLLATEREELAEIDGDAKLKEIFTDYKQYLTEKREQRNNLESKEARLVDRLHQKLTVLGVDENLNLINLKVK